MEHPCLCCSFQSLLHRPARNSLEVSEGVSFHCTKRAAPLSVLLLLPNKTAQFRITILYRSNVHCTVYRTGTTLVHTHIYARAHTHTHTHTHTHVHAHTQNTHTHTFRYYRRLLQMGVSNTELWTNLGLCCFYASQ